MAQQISIQRVSECEKVLNEVDINVAPIVNALWEIKDFKKEFPWLSSIDPYGNTYVNQLQKQHYIEELSRLALTPQGSYVTDLIGKLNLYLTETEIHQYIKLIGD